METIFSEKIDQVLGTGLWIPDIVDFYNQYEQNWLLDREQALTAADKLFAINVPILGGDAYTFREKDGWDFLGDGWSCDPLDQESEESYIRRCFQTTINYIDRFKPKSAQQVGFVIVPGNLNSLSLLIKLARPQSGN